jgi:DNA-binding NtrC family response regulator
MKNILIVDDERCIRITAKAFLEEEGYFVEVAEDAEAALAVLRSRAIDLVLTDIVLPRVTGVDLLRQIREMSPYVQVVMMTGVPTLETAAEALRLGAVDYLQKPIGKNDILKAVQNALKIKHLNDEKLRLAEENKNYLNHLEQIVKERTHALAVSESNLRHRAEELSALNRLSRR